MLYKAWDTEDPCGTCRAVDAESTYEALQIVRKVCPTANAVKPYGDELEKGGQNDRARD